MSASFTVMRATPSDAPEVAEMVGELLVEIMNAIGARAFGFDLEQTVYRLADYLERERYIVFVARTAQGSAAGFIAMCESYALYAEGAFGIVPELYVRPENRSKGLGRCLMSQATDFAVSRGWTRLEVTTPPLPEFDRTLAFYEREGFSISGGRKLKISLPRVTEGRDPGNTRP